MQAYQSGEEVRSGDEVEEISTGRLGALFESGTITGGAATETQKRWNVKFKDNKQPLIKSFTPEGFKFLRRSQLRLG
jgi:hypothetical protein